MAGAQGGFCRNEAVRGRDYCEAHDDPPAATSSLVAHVNADQIEDALRRAMRDLERHVGRDHHGNAHPVERGFEYRPDICPGCRMAILRALADKEVLYV